MVITIDGLGVNGKTTLAKMISEKINFKNFNTGAIYRCIALEIINKKLDILDINTTLKNLENIKIDFEKGKTYLNGTDVTTKIRTEEISVKSTKWATIPEIKVLVRKIQKDFLEKYDTIMEGRDIAERIAPNAEVKFYLYSDFEVRVKRLSDDMGISLEEARKSLAIRDDLDINGGNFVKPKKSIEINTSDKTISQVYDIMLGEIYKKMKNV